MDYLNLKHVQVCHSDQPFDSLELDLPHLFLEEEGVVDALTAGKNLLATDEDMLGVGQLGVFRIEHGVEGASVGGERIC